jgi:hypothetical protein
MHPARRPRIRSRRPLSRPTMSDTDQDVIAQLQQRHIRPRRKPPAHPPAPGTPTPPEIHALARRSPPPMGRASAQASACHSAAARSPRPTALHRPGLTANRAISSCETPSPASLRTPSRWVRGSGHGRSSAERHGPRHPRSATGCPSCNRPGHDNSMIPPSWHNGVRRRPKVAYAAGAGSSARISPE